MKYPKMLRDLLLVKIPKETKKNGIELPESAIEERRMAGGDGEVVATGKDVEEIKVGDIVVPKGYVGNALDIEDKDHWYLVIAEIDIMAIK